MVLTLSPTSKSMRRPFLRILLLAIPLVISACRDSSPVSYRIPKENDAPVAPPPAASNNMADTPVVKAEGPGLEWTAPARWHTKPASAMRKASYAVDGEAGAVGDISITAFPGDVGGELANVNRWRGQLQLPPLAESDLAGAVTRREQNGLQLTIVDFSSASADKQRMLGAIVPFNGATWFFKFTGSDALVASAKPDFIAFLQSIRAPDSTPTPVVAPAASDMANTAVIKAAGPGLKWTAPVHWHTKPASAMRKASYAIEGEAGAVGDISITAFPGDVGGELANVNRWRGQLQLPPLAEAELAGAATRREQNGLHLTIVDFSSASSANNQQRILGAIVPFNGATWFFKLTGPDALVAREKSAFLEFLDTLQAP